MSGADQQPGPSSRTHPPTDEDAEHEEAPEGEGISLALSEEGLNPTLPRLGGSITQARISYPRSDLHSSSSQNNK